jgi:hypothetical protein
MFKGKKFNSPTIQSRGDDGGEFVFVLLPRTLSRFENSQNVKMRRGAHPEQLGEVSYI